MNDNERMLLKTMKENFHKDRCKQCKYYVGGESDFCNLIWPDPNQCVVLAEELNLKGKIK